MSTRPESSQTCPILLLVEDDRLNRSMMFRFLSKSGYKVVLATNGEDGISLAKHWLPDLIIMDLELPVMHGLEAIAIIKTWAETAKIPVLCISANATAETKEEAFQIGCDDFKSKPFRLKEFLDRIEVLRTAGSEADRSKTSL